MPERRIVAIVLPELLCELVLAQNPFEQHGKKAPFAVVWRSSAPRDEPQSDARKAGERLAAVSDAARRAGVHVGQRVAEAQAELAHLALREIGEDEVRAALERVADVALAFGAPVAIELPDTVWVDVTGSAHLFGGEENLTEELAGRVQELAHRAQIAVASGPHLARAFARWMAPCSRGASCISARESAECMKKLPLQALSLDEERLTWFARLGVLEVGQLTSLPTKALASRLGTGVQRLLALAHGHDPAPLTAYEPPRELHEESSWEEPVSGLEPLLFVVRGLVARLSARLEGRGEAAKVLCVHFGFDRAIAKHRGVPEERELRFELSTPLWRESELERVVRSRLERIELGAPTRSLRVTVPELTLAPAHQLDLSGAASGSQRGLERLPVLLAELGADVGTSHLGVLALVDSHRPEEQCTLEAVKLARKRKPWGPRPPSDAASGAFTRLLPKPVALSGPLSVGQAIAIGSRLYAIEKLRFVQRLESVQWWTQSPTSRDYLRVWLSAQSPGSSRKSLDDRGGEGGLEALVFVDRATGKRYLQAIAD